MELDVLGLITAVYLQTIIKFACMVAELSYALGRLSGRLIFA